MAVTPTTHLEKSIAGAVQPVTHLEKVIAEYGGGGGGGAVSSVNGKTGAVMLTAADVGAAPLQLTATPTAGPSETTIMSGTWSGATWEEVVAAIQASRLIQIDVSGAFTFTLLYNHNVDSASEVDSVCFEFPNGDTTAVVKVRLVENGNLSIDIVALSDPSVNQIGDSNAVIVPMDNNVYECGELTSLTITDPPATGAYSIVFTSGSTATTTTIPATILGLDDFAAEANTLYEINVWNNRAVIGSWAVSV